jgi:hypothetical protein
MNKEELKTLAKKYFNLTEIETKSEDTVTEQKFVEATLADGTKITNMLDADFEVGQELHVITEEGEHVLAPSGEHTTESGIVLTVDGEGIITGVKHPDSEGEGSLTEEEMSTELAEEEVIEEIMEEGDIKEAIIEAIMETVAPEIEAMKQKMAEIEEKMKEYMSTPATQPTKEREFKKEGKELSFLDTKFDFKKAQLEAILNKK